jgi:hypothetical protein
LEYCLRAAALSACRKAVTGRYYLMVMRQFMPTTASANTP